MSGEVRKSLEATRERLEKWRREHGGKGHWIPDELWMEAVEAAQKSGIETTARVLRLKAGRLRDRMRRSEAGESGPGREEAAMFVELGALGGFRSVIETLGKDGQRMRIEITGPGPVDVAGVCGAFFGRRP